MADNITGPAGRGDGQFDPQFARKVAQALNDPFTQMQLIQPFLEYLMQRIAVAGIPVSISQVTGFQQFAAQSANVQTHESTASSSFGDLATAGPSITGLAPGEYLVFWGALAGLTPGGASQMGISVNGSDPSADSQTYWSVGSAADFAFKSHVFTASAENSTIKAVYRNSDGTGTSTFNTRNIAVLRVGNA